MFDIMIHVDGGTGGSDRVAGAAAVARTGDGQFVGWLSEQLPGMTNNEAEYHALMLGLNIAAQLGMRKVLILSDSEVMVRQMQGRSRVMSARLKLMHRDACLAVRQFKDVRFTHVPREQNRLADALASEAVTGRTVRMRPQSRSVFASFPRFSLAS